MTRILYGMLAAVLLLGCTAAVAEQGRPNHATGFQGEALIDTRGAAVLILIDTDKGGRDGFVDQWFRLESEAALPAVADHITAAHILQTAGYVRIVAPERRVAYDFVISGTGPVPDPPAGFTSVRVEGYGISHTQGPTSIQIPDLRRNQVTAFDCEACGPLEPCDDCGGAGGMSCTAGGEGSTSCSINSGTLSCSASCGQGYYACCNYTAYAVSCKCYRS